jgi:hypothetical protein
MDWIARTKAGPIGGAFSFQRFVQIVGVLFGKDFLVEFELLNQTLDLLHADVAATSRRKLARLDRGYERAAASGI